MRAGVQERNIKRENQGYEETYMSESHTPQESKQEQNREELGQKRQRERTHRKRRAIRHKEKERHQKCDDGERIKVTGHRKRNEHGGIPRVCKGTMQRLFHRGQSAAWAASSNRCFALTLRRPRRGHTT